MLNQQTPVKVDRSTTIKRNLKLRGNFKFP